MFLLLYVSQLRQLLRDLAKNAIGILSRLVSKKNKIFCR
jgi:hypothetical protein